MKQMTILVLTVIFSAGTFAKAPKKVSPKEIAKSLTKEIEKLNYSKEDDRFKGGEKARAAVKQLQDFDRLSRKNDHLALFKALLALSREAAPYDEERQIADVLSDMLKRESFLKNSYRDYLKSLPKVTKGAEFCKNEQFERSVAEATCEIENGGKAQDVAKAASLEDEMKCVSKFNFNDCLKKK